ncbi:NlpC/P60 family protein [Mycolicibacterium sp.]|uniref:NlpC/P60 family protein n=1 Tax=Mycolicibacterium sp. TaxID=2320850 RepID=UPI0028B1CB29|nr:NlpC/P60 family protein [Mycolicibacterium sp.]
MTQPCPDGYYLAYEDENNWYCEPLIAPSDTAEVIRKLDLQLSMTPPEKLRAEAIRLAKCMAQKQAAYKFGAKIEDFLGDCEKAATHKVDCSGLVQWIQDSAVCAVNGFCMAADKRASFTPQRSAADLYRLFGEKHSIRSGSDEAEPGDPVFFKYSSGSTKAADHIGIFLMKVPGGRSIHMIHGSERAGKVKMVTYPDGEWGMRIVGYGNLESLLE